MEDLENFKIDSVYKNGNLVVYKNRLLYESYNDDFVYPSITNVNIRNLTKKDLEINLKNKKTLNVIEINPNKLESNHLKIDINTLKNTNYFESDTNLDLLKIAVIERHNNTGNMGLGIIKGLNLKDGAIATTVAHDSHNLIICGTNDEDMLIAAEEIKKLNGGTLIVKDGEVLASIQLEIGGLITGRKSADVVKDLKNLHCSIKDIAPDINFNPFLTLSFLSLPVIPVLKITDKGLFDVSKFDFIDIAE